MPDESTKKNGPLLGKPLEDAVVAAVERGEGFTLELLRAIQVKEGEPIRVLQFREMRWKDMDDMPLNKAALTDVQMRAATARLTGVTPALLGELTARDARRCSQVLAVFLVGDQ